MDPQANIERQRELVAEILAAHGTNTPGNPMRDISDEAAELAELVQALDEWRLKGGFDPYSGVNPLSKAPVEHVQAILNYNWQDEARDFEEEDERGAGPCYADDGTRVWHVFEHMQIVQAWLTSLNPGE